MSLVDTILFIYVTRYIADTGVLKNLEAAAMQMFRFVVTRNSSEPGYVAVKVTYGRRLNTSLP
jgi:hypothetical protein